MSRMELRILGALAAAVLAAAGAAFFGGGSRGALTSFVAGAVVAALVGGWALRGVRRARASLTRWAQSLEADAPRGQAAAAALILADWDLSLAPAAARLRRHLDASAVALERLAALTDAMEDGVLVLDGSGRVLLANSRVRALLGCPTDPQGRPLVEAVRHAAILAALERAPQQPEPVVETLDLDPGGRRRVRLHARAVRSDEPSSEIVAVFRDVTQAQRVEAMRRDFVANASHELKTPLTAICGFAERLASARLPDRADAHGARAILAHAERLAMLVEDLLELSRIESAGSPPRAEPVDVGQWIERWFGDLEPRFREAGLTAEIETTGATKAEVDLPSLERVLANLVDNAIRYTERGGRVELRALGEPETLRISVSDTGIGIPSKALPRIFERFYRVDPARSRASGGTGLGLSIVRHLVEAMGGRVSVESRVGHGSRFTVTLPRSGRVEAEA